jgi:hypothetical protein
MPLSRLCLALLAIVLSSLPGAAAVAQHPGYWEPPDTVCLGCPVEIPAVSVGDSFSIPVHISNDDILCGFSLGFSYDAACVAIESINLERSILDDRQKLAIREYHLPEQQKSLVA